jgi:hypothetical protein
MSTHRRRLSVGTEPVTNLNAQMRELKRLRDRVRKAELSIGRPQRKSRRKAKVHLEKALQSGPLLAEIRFAMSFVSFILGRRDVPFRLSHLSHGPRRCIQSIQCGQTVAFHDRNQSRPALLSLREQAK